MPEPKLIFAAPVLLALGLVAAAPSTAPPPRAAPGPAAAIVLIPAPAIPEGDDAARDDRPDDVAPPFHWRGTSPTPGGAHDAARCPAGATAGVERLRDEAPDWPGTEPDWHRALRESELGGCAEGGQPPRRPPPGSAYGPI